MINKNKFKIFGIVLVVLAFFGYKYIKTPQTAVVKEKVAATSSIIKLPPAESFYRITMFLKSDLQPSIEISSKWDGQYLFLEEGNVATFYYLDKTNQTKFAFLTIYLRNKQEWVKHVANEKKIGENNDLVASYKVDKKSDLQHKEQEKFNIFLEKLPAALESLKVTKDIN